MCRSHGSDEVGAKVFGEAKSGAKADTGRKTGNARAIGSGRG